MNKYRIRFISFYSQHFFDLTLAIQVRPTTYSILKVLGKLNKSALTDGLGFRQTGMARQTSQCHIQIDMHTYTHSLKQVHTHTH